ncbi:hypothetical protein C8F01DRAFT_1227725 [Mycena amicta]|nr:hypothetical protein C8F01DRAFT_1227725 [Mycena amicta]
MNNNNPSKKKPSGSKKKKKPSQNQQGGSQTANTTYRGAGGSSGKGKGKQPQQAPPTLAARTAARKVVSERKRSTADREYNKALRFFDTGEYDAALSALKDACRLFKTQPRYAMKMASTLMKLERYDDAIDMATFRIAIEPVASNDAFDARFLRATAFLKSKQFGHAAADLINCRIDKPNAAEVQAAIEELHGVWEVDDEYFEQNPDEAEKDVVYPDMATCTANYYLDCDSDTEESTHVGNGRPCGNYNKGRCTYGSRCHLRHAVDSRSIRDRLGQNVCIFSILGRCHFASGNRCWYSHSTTHLPQQGWWNNHEYVAYYCAIYDLLKTTGSNEVMDLMLGGDMNGHWLPFERHDKFLAGLETLNKPENFRRAMQRQCDELFADIIGMDAKDIGRKGHKGVLGQAQRFFGGGGGVLRSRRRARFVDSDSDEYDSGGGYGYGGYDSDDYGGYYDVYEELMLQGIKPWDPEAGAALRFLGYWG